MPERVRAWVEAGGLGLPRSVNVECHDLATAVGLARTLTGCEPVEVFAEASGAVLVASMLMTHGVVASLVVGPVPGTGSARLIGSHGHTEIDLDEPSVRHHGPGGVRRIPVEPQIVHSGPEIVVEAFGRSLASGRPERVEP
ncbi:hypothetical protein ACQP1P_13030 [Dactylosporangium sp. CA-052675]|uniref:hypothetical protein n=1 Tax=Dactylosporangium sp. CA-052675 TaxID=3239927 RepID=UPI003D8D9308